MKTLPLTPFAKFAWGTLAYNLFVILFGAFVRATGSGAGCGAHWPLCNGVIVPRPERIETMIEFTHRVTSGLTMVLVVVLVVWAWRRFPKGSLVRLGTGLALLFTITEALVGAGLVLFQLVEYNDSLARAFSMMIHLVNTFLLVASLTITAWWSTTGSPASLRLNGIHGGMLVAGGLLMLLLGASGAVTALGDTLFPGATLADDFSPTAHYLIRLRVYHPAIAVTVGLYLALTTWLVRRQFTTPRIETISTGLFVLYGLQLVLGAVNVALFAPVWMQIVHLLVSNLIWISVVLLAVEVFSHLTPRLVHQEVNKPVHAVPGK